MGSYAVKLERSIPLRLDRHPEAPSDDEFLSWCAAQSDAGQRLAVDLFSGAGGLGAGVEAAGWIVVAAVDNDELAIETHAANFRGRSLQIDMSDPSAVQALIEMLRPIDIDLVVGGPPCQPFSRAGLAKIRSLVRSGARPPVDERRELWRSFVEVVVALRPRAVIMENVPDMAIGDDLVTVRLIAEQLERAEYAVDYRLLDAWKHGVPQHRKRFFLQARRDGIKPIWPLPSENRPVVRDAIEDLPALGLTTGARELAYTAEPTSALAKRLRSPAAPSVIFDHMTRPVREDDREAFSLMTSTTLYSELPEHLRRYRADTFDDKYKRLGWDDLSRTITAHIAKDGYWYIHPGEDRTLTVREAARIQTFSDDFRFAGSRSDAFRQIGNAVPPELGRAVASVAVPATSASENNQHDVAVLRESLARWARNDRKDRWWLYPGPAMSRSAALVACLLEVHRLEDASAAELMGPLHGITHLTPESLSHLDRHKLSAARNRRLRELRTELRHSNASAIETMEATFGSAASQRLSLLSGNDELVISDAIGRRVLLLMSLPMDARGLRTDVKVALAQLVGVGPDAPLRMSAIMAMSIDDARALRTDGMVGV